MDSHSWRKILKNQLMKRITTLLASALIAGATFGQTSLPAAWNFDDPQPVGWTEELSNNPGNTRYTNGSVGAACKLDGDDEYVVVHFSDVCGGVTYDLIGQGNASNDIFTVQESADGSAWTTMREFNESDLSAANSWTEFTDVPLSTSRYVRWYFTEKQSGRNVGLDEVTLIEQVPTNDQEIGVSSGVTPIINNGTFVVGNQATTTISIENVNLLGGTDLTISSIALSGPNAADFSLGTTPTVVGPTAVEQFDLNFTAGASGSRFATLTIENDDANGDETTFVIELYGIGGDYATEPVDQPTNMAFSDVTSYGFDVSFADGASVPENYIVLRSIGVPIPAADNPVDGMTYVKGDYINGTQVVHVGSAETFRPKYVVAGQQYYFAAYAFNGPSGYENYLTGAPLTADQASAGAMIGNYYQGIDPNSTSFLTDLQTRISQNYDQIFYSNYGPVMINKFASRDTTGGQSVVTGVYSGYQYMYTGAFFYDVLSREHSWPHSWMPAFPDQEGDEYSDFHNLFPVHQDNANAVRSNRPLGVVETQASSFLDAQYGDNADGQRVYEPRDQHKGDAARAIFYMATKWNGESGSWELPNPIDFLVQYGQDQDVLKQWHWQDPPDAWEIARNDFIESEQGNRNPFVDSVDWVCYIDFETLTYIGAQSTPCTVTPDPDGIEEQLAGEFSITPNPTEGVSTLNLLLNEPQELNVRIVDVTGREVANTAGNYNAGMNRETLDLTSLDAGIYHVILQGEKARTTLKVVVK